MLTSVNDYLSELQEQYPTVPAEDIKRAVEYGWRMLYYYNLRGCDTLISSSKYRYWFYCGELTRDSMKHFSYYKRMLRRKLRVLYIKKVKEWDGYYYTGLTDKEYDELLSALNSKRGRKKRNFKFYNKLGLKVLDEAKVYYSWSRCIVRFRYITDMGYSFFKPELKCTPEIVITKDKPSTFKDILITSNNYELINYEKGSN